MLLNGGCPLDDLTRSGGITYAPAGHRIGFTEAVYDNCSGSDFRQNLDD